MKEKVQQRASLIPPAVCESTLEPGKSLRHNFVCLFVVILSDKALLFVYISINIRATNSFISPAGGDLTMQNKCVKKYNIIKYNK